MITEDKKHPIGEKILSFDFGVGIISGIEKLQKDGDDFYIIEYGKKNEKNYFPKNKNTKIRFLSAEADFLESIQKLKTKKIKKIFSSRKERQSYFSVALRNCALDQVVEKILEIKSISDLLPNESDKLTRLINTLELEASIIYNFDLSMAQEFISNYLNKTSKKKA